MAIISDCSGRWSRSSRRSLPLVAYAGPAQSAAIAMAAHLHMPLPPSCHTPQTHAPSWRTRSYRQCLAGPGQGHRKANVKAARQVKESPSAVPHVGLSSWAGIRGGRGDPRLTAITTNAIGPGAVRSGLATKKNPGQSKLPGFLQVVALACRLL
jgi:hypothetical protein